MCETAAKCRELDGSDVRAGHFHITFGDSSTFILDSKTTKNLYYVFLILSHSFRKMHSYAKIFPSPSKN